LKTLLVTVVLRHPCKLKPRHGRLSCVFGQGEISLYGIPFWIRFSKLTLCDSPIIMFRRFG